MAEFTVGAEVRTDVPTVEVTVTPNNPLPIGRQIFRLVVVDDAGNASRADQVEVIVADQDAPTAVIRGPRVVGTGRPFELDGSGSFDVGGGRIVAYLWTYVGPAG